MQIKLKFIKLFLVFELFTSLHDGSFKAAKDQRQFAIKHVGQTSVYSRDAVAQFNVNIKPKDGAYMTKSEIEAFNMYECLKGAR